MDIPGSRRFICAATLHLVLLLIITGCALAPKTSALKKVHDLYRDEFAQYVMPPAPDAKKGLDTWAADSTAFARTLQSIRDYRVQYGEESRESGHLQILEGMIYLQSGRLGMAKLVKDDVEARGEELRSRAGGHYTRDYLLGTSFGHLIAGWQEIRDCSDTDDRTVCEYEELEKAADGISEKLIQLDPSMLAAPEVDQGGIYLATTGAIFYVWVHAQRDGYNEADSSVNWFEKGRGLIGRFLTDKEKELAVKKTEALSESMIGRMRYMAWYGYLDKQAKKAN